MSELVEDLLHFFEMREGEHISDVDIEDMMDKAALRIEELEEKVRLQLDEILSLDADKKELESRELGYIQSLRELEAELIACKDSNAALSDACLDWEAKNVKLEARVRELEAYLEDPYFLRNGRERCFYCGHEAMNGHDQHCPANRAE